MEMADGLGERGDVDPFRRQGTPHGVKEGLEDRAERLGLVGVQIGQLVNVANGLQHGVSPDEAVHPVLRPPEITLEDDSARRGDAACIHIAGEAVDHLPSLPSPPDPARHWLTSRRTAHTIAATFR